MEGKNVRMKISKTDIGDLSKREKNIIQKEKLNKYAGERVYPKKIGNENLIQTDREKNFNSKLIEKYLVGE